MTNDRYRCPEYVGYGRSSSVPYRSAIKVQVPRSGHVKRCSSLLSNFVLLVRGQGLLDVAFGPMFGQDGYEDFFYVSYTVFVNGDVSPSCTQVDDVIVFCLVALRSP